MSYDADTYIQMWQPFVREYMEQFFLGKKDHEGNKITAEQLHVRKHYELVLGVDFCPGIDLCYECLLDVRNGKSIRLVNKLLERTRRIGVPKQLQAGLLLVALRLCYGREVVKFKPNYDHLVAETEEVAIGV